MDSKLKSILNFISEFVLEAKISSKNRSTSIPTHLKSSQPLAYSKSSAAAAYSRARDWSAKVDIYARASIWYRKHFLVSCQRVWTLVTVWWWTKQKSFQLSCVYRPKSSQQNCVHGKNFCRLWIVSENRVKPADLGPLPNATVFHDIFNWERFEKFNTFLRRHYQLCCL